MSSKVVKGNSLINLIRQRDALLHIAKLVELRKSTNTKGQTMFDIANYTKEIQPRYCPSFSGNFYGSHRILEDNSIKMNLWARKKNSDKCGKIPCQYAPKSGQEQRRICGRDKDGCPKGQKTKLKRNDQTCAKKRRK